MSELSIRPFREGDTEAVATLWREVFADAPPWNAPENDIRLKLAVQRELFLVGELARDRPEAGRSSAAERGPDPRVTLLAGRIVATAMAGYDGHRGYVYYVGVAPEHRRCGFGRSIMEEVERRLRELGCPKFNLQIRGHNLEAVAFYERLGFCVEDRISLSKRLA